MATFTYYIDGDAGSNSNDGLTPATAYLTMEKVFRNHTHTSGDTINMLVKPKANGARYSERMLIYPVALSQGITFNVSPTSGTVLHTVPADTTNIYEGSGATSGSLNITGFAFDDLAVTSLTSGVTMSTDKGYTYTFTNCSWVVDTSTNFDMVYALSAAGMAIRNVKFTNCQLSLAGRFARLGDFNGFLLDNTQVSCDISGISLQEDATKNIDKIHILNGSSIVSAAGTGVKLEGNKVKSFVLDSTSSVTGNTYGINIKSGVNSIDITGSISTTQTATDTSFACSIGWYEGVTGQQVDYRSKSTNAPSSPETNSTWFQTDTEKFFKYNGSAWIEVVRTIGSVRVNGSKLTSARGKALLISFLADGADISDCITDGTTHVCSIYANRCNIHNNVCNHSGLYIFGDHNQVHHNLCNGNGLLEGAPGDTGWDFPEDNNIHHNICTLGYDYNRAADRRAADNQMRSKWDYNCYWRESGAPQIINEQNIYTVAEARTAWTSADPVSGNQYNIPYGELNDANSLYVNPQIVIDGDRYVICNPVVKADGIGPIPASNILHI